MKISNKQKPTLLLGSCILLLAALPNTGFARGSKGGEVRNTLSNAAGQVDSSYNGGVMVSNHNVANLIRNTGTNVVLEIDSPDGDFDPTSFGAALLFGSGGKWGAGFGAFSSTASGAPFILTAGAAVSAGRTLAIGLNAFFNTDNSSLDGNISLLFNQMGRFRVGANIYSLNAGFNAIGTGVAFDLNHNFTLGLDLTGNEDFELKVFTPGIRFNHNTFSASAGYAIALGDSGVLGIRNIGQAIAVEDFYAAVGFWLANRVNIKYQYQNKNSDHYVTVGFNL